MLCVVCIILIVKNLVLGVGGFEPQYEGQADEMASQSISSSVPTVALVTFRKKNLVKFFCKVSRIAATQLT